MIVNIIDCLSIIRSDITILLDDKNIDFVKSLYRDENDILSVLNSKKDIYRRQSINTFDFGKIVVLANGDVHSNLNFESLGNIYQEDFSAIVTQEIQEGKAWFRIRDGVPCNDCIYQWLCPSPSNYELVTDRLNFCHIK